MPTKTMQADRGKLPRNFADLVRLMPPQAILDETQYDNTVEWIDRLMVAGKLTAGQALYLETLVQLVRAYEDQRHAIETKDISGLDTLKHLMEESHMNASDLARLLGIHPSMGSKLLKGERALTVEHLRKLSAHFKVGPELFID
jgi:antitoxin component HigA of HigAB toxin-antitoxin module